MWLFLGHLSLRFFSGFNLLLRLYFCLWFSSFYYDVTKRSFKKQGNFILFIIELLQSVAWSIWTVLENSQPLPLQILFLSILSPPCSSRTPITLFTGFSIVPTHRRVGQIQVGPVQQVELSATTSLYQAHARDLGIKCQFLFLF